MTKTNGRASERGTVMVMVAVWLPILALFVSFAIDIAHFFDYSRNLQNRADAAALAAGDQYGGTCFGSPTASDMAPIGQMAQLFSGPTGLNSDLLYPYSGAGSPLTAFPQYPWASTYQNVPNLSNSNEPNGKNFHVFLNADNYAADGGTQLAIGDYCNGNPTLDKTDKECYGQTNLSGQLAVDCATAPMIDVKLTQTNLPLFFPLTSIAPNISAHARVTLHALESASQLLPLGVGDAAYVPCVKVKFISDDGSVSPTTLQLQLNKTLTKQTGNPVWDNSPDNGGAGDPVAMPTTAGHYDYMQAMLYSQDPTTGTCGGTPRNSITYPLSSSGSSTTDGILDTETAPSSSLGTLAADAVPRIDAGGIVLSQGNGNPDQYFSSTGDYAVNVTANIAFSSNAGTINVWAVDTNTGDMSPLTHQVGTNTWSGSLPSSGSLSAQSGQHPICIQVSQTGGLTNNQKSTCPKVSGSPGGGGSYYSLGIQHETFAACNEATSACSNDESGPIIQARIGNVTVSNGVPVVDWSQRVFTPNTSPNLMVQLELQGLYAATRYDPATGTGDLCANGQCTVLRLDNAGNGNGAIDCGEGNGATAIESVMLSGCPTYSNPPVAPCTNIGYCGNWTKSTDGTCNNTANTRPAGGGPVDCVNTNNGGANISSCVAALIQTGGSVTQSNCNVTGAQGCAVDHWLQGDAIPVGDPRVMSAFIVFSGDIINASGNTQVPIRDFAAFYVTGWKFQGGGQVNCPTGVNPTQANEPPPPSAAGAKNAIWGHWITYTVPGKGNPQEICDPQAIGECTPVLTR
jgi:Putative Flp pilus-assembly TadE/G-like